MFFFPYLETQPNTIEAFIIIAVITPILEELQNLLAGFLAILDALTTTKDDIVP